MQSNLVTGKCMITDNRKRRFSGDDDKSASLSCLIGSLSTSKPSPPINPSLRRALNSIRRRKLLELLNVKIVSQVILPRQLPVHHPRE